MIGRAARRHQHHRVATRRFRLLASRDETAAAELEPGRLDPQGRRVGHRSDAPPSDAKAPDIADWLDDGPEADPAA